MGQTFDPTKLLPLDDQLVAAWRQAGAVMGIRVTAPFELPVGNRVFRYGALVAGFGTAAGVLLRAMLDEFHPDECGEIWAAAREAGYAGASLSPLLCRFNRDEFVLCLDTFGWCGPVNERPVWYTGPPPTEQRQAEPVAAPDPAT